jgi:hypothetical protein
MRRSKAHDGVTRQPDEVLMKTSTTVRRQELRNYSQVSVEDDKDKSSADQFEIYKCDMISK